jgi:hypothetical protein
MSEKLNENEAEVALLELRQRNLKAAQMLAQWIKEAETDSDEDQTDWPAVEKELLTNDLQFFEPEEP